MIISFDAVMAFVTGIEKKLNLKSLPPPGPLAPHCPSLAHLCRVRCTCCCQAATFVGVFFFVGVYIMLVSLMLATTGGKPWSSNSGRTLLLAHGILLVSPALTRIDVIPDEYGVS